MGLKKKALVGIGKALTMENSIANDGGLSSLLIPRQVNAAGAALIIGGGFSIGLANEAIQGHNRVRMGRISYGTQARMTKSFTSGAVEAMHRASKGNYAAFSDMAEEVMTNNSLGGIVENYGATPALISALYGMGR